MLEVERFKMNYQVVKFYADGQKVVVSEKMNKHRATELAQRLNATKTQNVSYEYEQVQEVKFLG